MQYLTLFASGTGSNAKKIISFFKDHDTIRVNLLVSNNPHAKALEMAGAAGVPTFTVSKYSFYETEELIDVLTQHQTTWVVLAGFLWLIPPYLLGAFPNRVFNIHPALLPAYGGRGMYGMHVHRAVKANEEERTGITIHRVNERYDEGEILFQASCAIEPTDTPELIAKKVQTLEHQHFAAVIEQTIMKEI